MIPPRQTGLLALLWLVGVYLRLPILVAPPLAPQIGADLTLSQAQIGALTTLPVLMLAVGALPGSFAIARLGPANSVALSLLLLAGASAARGLAPTALLLLGFTAAMGLAIAVMQPALPALVQRWTPGSLALGTAVYMNGLLIGEFLGAGLTLPFMMPWLNDDWRAVLVVWSLPAVLLAGVVWRRGRAAGTAAAGVETSMEAVTWRPPWRDPRMWQLGILLGAASAGFFGANAYMGSVLAVEGRSADLATLLFWFNAMQVAGSLLMLALARRLVGRHGSLLGVAAGVVLGLVGFAAGGDAILLPSVLLLGLCTCVQLILVVSLVPLITSPAHTGALAAGTFMVGYLLGFGVPMLGGVLADVAGQPRLALLPLIILASLAVVVAVGGRFGHGSEPIQHD